MRILFVTLFILLGQFIMAQQDSLPPTKKADTLDLDPKEGPLLQSKDSIAKDKPKGNLKKPSLEAVLLPL